MASSYRLRKRLWHSIETALSGFSFRTPEELAAPSHPVLFLQTEELLHSDQGALRDALCRRLDLPLRADLPYERFIRAAIDADLPLPAASTCPGEISYDGRNFLLSAEEDIVEHVARCLANGMPALVDVPLRTWGESQSDLLRHARCPRHLASAYIRSAPVLVPGRSDDPFALATSLHGASRRDGKKAFWTLTVWFMKDGGVQAFLNEVSWLSAYLDHLRTMPSVVTLIDAMERSRARCLAPAGRSIDASSLDGLIDIFGHSWSFQGAQFSRQPNTYGHSAWRSELFNYAIATAVTAEQKAAFEQLRLFSRYPVTLSPGQWHQYNATSAFDALRTLIHASAPDAGGSRRLHQAIALAPFAINYPIALKRCREGAALSSAIAEGLLAADPSSVLNARHWSLKTLPLLRSPEKSLERAARLAIGLYDEQRTATRTGPHAELYLMAMALISERNTHIRPKDWTDVRIMADLFHDTASELDFGRPRPNDVFTMQEQLATDFLRRVVSSLDGHFVRPRPESWQDVIAWATNSLGMIGVGAPDGEITRVYTRLGRVLCDAAAIRLGGASGADRLNRRWHAAAAQLVRDRHAMLRRPDEPASAPDSPTSLQLPDMVISGVSVRCLTSAEELMLEGEELGHCVGTYASAVSTGRSFILRLASPGDRSTVELRFDKPSCFVVTQHQARDREQPSERHSAAIQAYLPPLNQDRDLLRRVGEEVAIQQAIGARPQYGDALDNPRMQALIEAQIATVLLPPSMHAATRLEIEAFALAQQQVEHLTKPSLAA